MRPLEISRRSGGRCRGTHAEGDGALIDGILVVALGLLGAILPAACASDTSWAVVDRVIETSYPAVGQITADSLVARLQADGAAKLLLLDVRTAEEFAVSHIEGAVRIDPENPDFAVLDSLDRSHPIVTYCSVGYRSADLAEQLEDRGFEDVSNLRGSIFRWANEGRPLYRNGMEVRQVHPYDRAWGRLLDRELHAYEPGDVSSALTAQHTAAGQDPPAFPVFIVHRIDTIGRQLGQTALADLDNDGDLDWVAGQADRAGGDVWWWEYRGPDHWVRHPLGKGNTDVGGAAFDVNGDGWIDVLSGSKLLLNTGKPRLEAFLEYDVGTTYSHDTEFAHINGDRRMDVVANWDEAGLYWYEIPSDPTRTWTSHLIAAASAHEVHGGVSPRAVGDLDGDGDHDVVTGEAWYENVDGEGLQWRPHENIDFGEVHRYGLAVRTWVADLDGDGDLDFVQAEADNPDGRVAWFENDGSGNWERHLIKQDGDRQDFHSLAVADFDMDGDLDVFSGGGPLSEQGTYTSYIWENLAVAGESPGSEGWREHVVGRKPIHEVEADDVDRDGDIDLVGKPWSVGNEHFFLRNTAADAKR